jgi:drug/metabolite transporter (DMT)-like permease
MYAQIAFGMLGGWLIFDHRPDALSVGGMLLIAASGVGAALFSARASVRALESTEH